MGDTDSVPGCIGYYPKAIAPNDCKTCAWTELCKRMVAKERLEKLLAGIREAKAILKG